MKVNWQMFKAREREYNKNSTKGQLPYQSLPVFTHHSEFRFRFCRDCGVERLSERSEKLISQSLFEIHQSVGIFGAVSHFFLIKEN